VVQNGWFKRLIQWLTGDPVVRAPVLTSVDAGGYPVGFTGRTHRLFRSAPDSRIEPCPTLPSALDRFLTVPGT